MFERVDAALDALRVLVHDEVDAKLFGLRVAKCVHLAELPRGVHVDQRERRLAGIERLHCQVQHDRAVFTNAVQHRRVVTLGDGLAHDVDGLGLQALQVRQSLS